MLPIGVCSSWRLGGCGMSAGCGPGAGRLLLAALLAAPKAAVVVTRTPVPTDRRLGPQLDCRVA
jgi:hypothetical protein